MRRSNGVACAVGQPDFGESSQSVALTLRAGPGALHIIFNAYWEPLDFELPAARGDARRLAPHRRHEPRRARRDRRPTPSPTAELVDARRTAPRPAPSSDRGRPRPDVRQGKGGARRRHRANADGGRRPPGGRLARGQPVVRVGPVSRRARMGLGPRGLQRGRRRLEFVPARPRPIACLPLERGRDGRHERRLRPAVRWGCRCGTASTRSSRSGCSG